MPHTTTIYANFVDILQKTIFPAEITIKNGKIESIFPIEKPCLHYVMPAFVDAHIHIESSMLVPSEFARLAVIHGTIATVSDPHEIANVLGVAGVEFMIENGKKVPFKFFFGVPSCVPATVFETAGATIDAKDVEYLFEKHDLKYLAEMMNYPGVLYDDAVVLEKIKIAQKYKKPIDGHAPGLRGEQAKKYISAGISTDHECFMAAEAQDKLNFGMKILIREGSAAKNFEALIDLLPENYENMMFCSDDKHPDNLLVGHINELVKRAIMRGIDVFKVLQCACINPVKHYNLEVGLLNVGDLADFIVVEDLKDFKVLQTYIEGVLVAENGQSFINSVAFDKPNFFKAMPKNVSDFTLLVPPNYTEKTLLKVIEAIDGELITKTFLHHLPIENINGKDFLMADVANDILKIVVVNRYTPNAMPAVAFIKNFGLKNGAIASSVAHDSHNIIAVGTSDESICAAVNAIIGANGGLCVCDNRNNENKIGLLALPVAGLMSDLDGATVGALYTALDKTVKQLGSTLKAPFMSLSFMALLVIPQLKLSDIGLFDGGKFEFVEL